MPERVDLIAWSDYLCPWCYNAAVRLRRLENELDGQVHIEWRTFLLRPHTDPTRTREKFVAYTQSWMRPAAEPDGGTFRVWSTDEGPPSHSVPPHLVAKAAATISEDAFRAMHERLLHAYFAENRDISARETLAALWRECGLPESAFERAFTPETHAAVVDDHRGALERGVTGVPAVMMVGNDVPMLGAMPYETYRRWIARALGREG